MENDYSPMSTETIAQFVKTNFPKLSMKQQIELTQYVIEEGGLSYVSKQDMQEYVSKYMKKGNAMKNSLEAKKLAVIKSNAAPEVKLKALEKLNAIENNFLADYQKMIQAYQAGNKKIALEMAKKLSESGSKDAAKMKDVQHVLKQLGEIGASDNAAPDDKLAGSKKALSALLSSLGYAQMSKDVLKETELEKLKPYGRAVLSDMQKQTNPAIKDKLPRVQELLSKLGVL